MRATVPLPRPLSDTDLPGPMSSTVTDQSIAKSAPLVPYITEWSSEHYPSVPVVARGRWGIGYARERRGDRDHRGVLWTRITTAPGNGRPLFRRVHPLRQRRAMRQLLCQICGGPADRNEQGVLWLLGEADKGWTGSEVTGQPPVCLPCALVASRACPHLRGNALALRVRHAPIEGVSGILYRPGPNGPVRLGPATLPYTDPRTRRLQAFQLMRGLYDCTVVDLPATGRPVVPAAETARARQP
jgi:hypothetical protein